MTRKTGWFVFAMLIFCACLPMATKAQQTLGAINGTVTDTTNAVVIQAAVQVKNLGTGLTVNATTQHDGSYNIANLPIGTYSVSISKQGFKTEVHSNILVRGNLTTTVNATLQPGEVSSTVTVTGTPLLNQTDTTNGYTLGTQVIESTPLGTGSFTQLAILAPGVNADLLSGSGSNTGLGNQNIFANGQRDTSNSFSVNAINSNNLFNGKSSSQVSGNRLTFNTGESFLGGGQIFTGTSVYDAIGEALPSPPPETIEELHVNTSMYDASQGANSGAHIELTTKSGTNDYHGELYEYHQTTGWNANPFFFNARGIPRQPLHRNTFGGLLGGPIIHNKMFFFASYQGQRASDNVNGISQVSVPPDLTDSNRTAQGLATMANLDFSAPNCGTGTNPACLNIQASQIDPVALAILTAKAPGGGFLVPSSTVPGPGNGFQDATLFGPASRFTADQVNGNIDYDFGTRDRLATKYYYQRDPTTNPFAESQLLGATQSLNAGSQVISIDNTTQLSSNMTWEQKAGFIRQTAFATTGQALTPSQVGLNLFGSTKFPSIFVNNSDGASSGDSLTVGPTDNFANAGVFQNQWEAASNVDWFHGIHNLSFGFTWDHNQLNIVNHNNQVANLSFSDFPSFLQGLVRPGIGFSTLFNGASNRYYRANQVGLYVQDDIKLRPNLTLNAGLRWDWDGPLTEKNGFLTNFVPQNYSYSLASDTVNNIGLVVAGDNKTFGTKGVSNSTLTGRQWGISPRIGLVWSPGFVKNFVVRTGFGMYYDRGEFFTEFSPSAGFGFNGPFGVTLAPPFVVPVISNCASGTDCFAAPFGTTAPPPPPGNLSQVASLVPCQGLNGTGTCQNPQAGGITVPGLIQGNNPFLFGGYDPRNKLPYSENWTLDLQWQPTNTLMLDLGYVGNHGVHETLPIPFNEPKIATAQNPVNGQNFSFGYNVPEIPQEDPKIGGIQTTDGGNTDLRVPFVGYSPSSMFYEAEGVSHYNALQFGVNKRLSKGLLVTGSYTWSHALDEGSGLQLFYNGNDPLNPRSAYGNSGFDRTHVFVLSYLYQFPRVARCTGVVNTLINGWGFSGVTVAESGQPYSVTDFSGSVGSIFFGQNDAITNPIVPIAPGKTIADAILQGTTGVNPANPILNKNAFGITQLVIAPGTGGVPPCATVNGSQVCDNFELPFGNTGRNIFRGPFQTRFDFGIFKNFKINERFSLKYDAQFFNLFNHPSFDTPNNNVSFNSGFCNPPSPSFSCSPPGFATIPSGRLGFITHTLGSSRFIQMALHLTF
ncbi:MAG: TonB-dependent receptor domain-containing protein [Candidatus Acidiferrales bacterium]